MSTSIDEIVARFKKANPSHCQFMGVQETYGKVVSYDKNHIARRIEELKDDKNYVSSKLTQKQFGEYTELEYEALQHMLIYELFELEEEKEFTNNPTLYINPLNSIQSIYTARTYAPLQTRVRHIIETEEGVIQLLDQAFNQLNEVLPKAKVDITFKVATSTLGYLKDELLAEIMKTDDKNLIEQWSKINMACIEKIESFTEKLEQDYLPKVTEEFALGEEKFLRFLEKSEGITIPSAKLLTRAEEDLEKNYITLQGIIKRIGKDKFLELEENYPKENELLEVAKKIVTQTREFIVEKDLITIPTNDKCLVTESPKGFYRVLAFAALNPSNIAEDSESKESYYYISPPESDWTEKEKSDYLKFFGKGTLDLVTVHEVWPGHFLHMLHMKQLTPILRLFGFAITTIEGWAHYTEEMVIEQKYDKIDPVAAHIGQLKAALMRNCRFISAVKMHCGNMTVEESKKLFMEKALMSEKGAEKEAMRGTVDPMYLNYTLGKLIIKKLRTDYEKEHKDYTIKKFHDHMMSFGGIPLTLIRKNMLKNPGNDEDIL